MCLVKRYFEISAEIARLELLKDEIANNAINICSTTGTDKLMGEDGIHYLKYTPAQEPKWHDPAPEKAKKYLEGYTDNGRKASVRFY